MKLKSAHKFFLILLLILGVASQSLTMIRSGLVYSFGMGFWGPNGHDGIWHLALANQVLQGFPPPHPTFAGQQLTNYHYFYDLLLLIGQRLTAIPAQYLYFQIFPVLLALSLGLLSFLVGYFWQKDFWTGFWLAFFNYFAGSFGWLVTLWRNGQLGGESLFWAMQSISTLINPPFALSLVVLLTGMFCLLKIKTWSPVRILGVSFLFGVLINIKVYAGIVALGALGAFTLVKFLKEEKVYFFVFGLALLIGAAVFMPVNRVAGSLLVFQPFWFIHSMIESADRLYWPQLALARYTLQEGGLGPKLILIEGMGLVLFLVGNLGTRIIGFWDLLKRIKKLNEFDFFLITAGLIGFLIPLFFVQKGTAWNTIQFFYYFLFFANFYAAAALGKIMGGKNRLKFILPVLIIFLTLPTTIATLPNYLGWPPPTAVGKGEMAALHFLKNQKEGFVLTFPYDEFEKKKYQITPIPLVFYETTAYVSAFSGKQTFLEDQVNLTISGYDWGERRQEIVKFFASQDPIFARGVLLNNQIGYIYLVGEQKFKLNEDQLGIVKIFNNGLVRIYKVSGII